QRHGHPGGGGQAHRLRTHHPLPPRVLQARQPHRHPQLPRPRADPPRHHRPPRRPVRPGRDRLRDLHRRPPPGERRVAPHPPRPGGQHQRRRLHAQHARTQPHHPPARRPRLGHLPVGESPLRPHRDHHIPPDCLPQLIPPRVRQHPPPRQVPAPAEVCPPRH